MKKSGCLAVDMVYEDVSGVFANNALETKVLYLFS